MISNLAVVGTWQVGKTSTLLRLAHELRALGYAVGGVVQPALRAEGRVQGYDLLDVASGDRTRLARRLPVKLPGKMGFAFDDGAFQWAAERILAARREARVVVVDEIGRLEADTGQGHLPALTGPCPCDRVRVRLLGIREDRAIALSERLGGFQRSLAVPLDEEAYSDTLAWIRTQLAADRDPLESRGGAPQSNAGTP